MTDFKYALMHKSMFNKLIYYNLYKVPTINKLRLFQFKYKMISGVVFLDQPMKQSTKESYCLNLLE